MNKAANAYFKTKVSTTDQGHLLIMLYDGALKFLQQAREKIIARDFAAKGILISKVIDIVNELAGSLNMEKGGSLATNLNNLYLLCTARLLQANLKMDLKALDSVVSILQGLRSAYAEILNRPEAQSAVQQIASRIQPMASTSQRSQPLNSGTISSSPVGGTIARNAYSRMMQSAPQPQPAKEESAQSETLASDPIGMQNFMTQQNFAAQQMRGYGRM
ncbi:MAG: flagellar export chaperone FliS [Desulfovibrio sp.]|nr:flagellar export chaperone FliS [Desulfovibrio sp.]